MMIPTITETNSITTPTTEPAMIVPRETTENDNRVKGIHNQFLLLPKDWQAPLYPTVTVIYKNVYWYKCMYM